MTKEIIVSAIIGFVLGILVAPAMPFTWTGGMMNGNNMMGIGNNQMMTQIDQHFIEQMIPHHEDAITMAHLATEKAQHQEIKNLAEDIIKTQTAEIEKMQAWYKSWYGREVVLIASGFAHGMMMRSGMMGDETDIEALENAKDFDKEFIEQMIPHHQMAIMMSEMLKRSTNRPEMRQLADDIISAQTKEIEQMREWYRTWYGDR